MNKDKVTEALKSLGPKFVDYLIQKLKVGNLRIAHLNALPGRSRNRFSIADFKPLGLNVGEQLLELLLTKEKFSMPITLPTLGNNGKDKALETLRKQRANLARRLNNISYDLGNEIQEFGTQSFGFGFPLIIIRSHKDPSKILIAPLIIWYLELKKNRGRADSWKLSKSLETPISFNQILFNYLKDDWGVDFGKLKAIEEKIQADGKIDKQEFQEIVSMFAKTMGSNVNFILEISAEAGFEVLDNKEDCEEILESRDQNLTITRSGTFAFYRTYKESLIHDLENVQKNLDHFKDDNLDVNDLDGDSFASVKTDPSQKTILEIIKKSKNILIQGPPGTGKSQSLTAIITNALQKGATCLVVCEKKTAMDIIYKNLKDLGLSDFATIIDDPIKDRQVVVKKLRDREERIEQGLIYSLDSNDLDRLTKTYSANQKVLGEHHEEKNSNIFGEETRKNLIGLNLKFHGPNPLSSLKPNNLGLNYDEFLEIRNSLKKLETLSAFLLKEDPLMIIAGDITKLSLNETKSKLKKDFEELIELAETISKQNKVFQDTLPEVFNSRVTRFINKFNQISQDLMSSYNSLAADVKDSFLKKPDYISKFDRIATYISKKKLSEVNFKEKWIETKEDLRELRLKLNELKIKAIPSLPNDFESFIKTLTAIKKTLTNNFSVELSFKDVYLKTRLTDKNFLNLKAWDTLLDSIEDYNNKLKTSLYGDVLAINSNVPLPEFLPQYENRVQQLYAVQERMLYIRDYRDMQVFIFEQAPVVQKIMRQMLGDKDIDWQLAFNNWYIHSFLSRNPAKKLLRNDLEIVELIRAHKEVRNVYTSKIIREWNEKGYRRLNKLNSSAIRFRSLYNLKGAPGQRRNSLRQIMAVDLEGFKEFYPVILANPTTVSSIFPAQKDLFDLVIFDEASQLRIEDTLSSLLRGTHKVISGDKHQMPPSSFFSTSVTIDEEYEGDDNETAKEDEDSIDTALLEEFKQQNLLNLVQSESLLEFAEELNFDEKMLDIHYRSHHPDLIEFSNRAFYKSKLIPSPAYTFDDQYKPISFWQINSQYNSKPENNNPGEADKVIEIVEDEFRKNNKVSIGIATLNLNQRNLIWDELSNKASTDSEFASMLSQLEANGLFIKNLENVQGDERDVIIISTTFGKKSNGSFIQNFGPLNRKGGYRLLNVLITRAREKVHVVTSIPEDKYLGFEKDLRPESNDGRSIFYAYLAYARAVSENDVEQKDRILKALSRQIDEAELLNSSLELTESPFEEEVLQRLIRVIDSKNIELQKRDGGFRLDIVVFTQDVKKKIAIECDGATYHRNEEDYYWDIFRQEYLENFGYKFYRIWSENWWEDTQAEEQKLLDFLKKEGVLFKTGQE